MLEFGSGSFGQFGDALAVSRNAASENAALMFEGGRNGKPDERQARGKENEDDHHRPCAGDSPPAKKTHDGGEQVGQNGGNRNRCQNRLQVTADRHDAPTCNEDD